MGDARPGAEWASQEDESGGSDRGSEVLSGPASGSESGGGGAGPRGGMPPPAPRRLLRSPTGSLGSNRSWSPRRGAGEFGVCSAPLPPGVAISPVSSRLTQTRSIRAAAAAAEDMSVSPQESLRRHYATLKDRMGIQDGMQSLTLTAGKTGGGCDECLVMMDEVAEKRYDGLQRVKRKYEGDWRCNASGSDMHREMDEVNLEADRCQKLVWYMEVIRRCVWSVFSIGGESCWDPDGRAPPQCLNIRTIKELHDDKGLSVYNQCVLYIQECFRYEDLRRHDGAVFTKVLNSAGHVTIAWKRMDNVRQFIYKHINQNVRPDLWTAITNAQTVDKLEKYYVESENPSFPPLKKNRSLFSFDDGVFDARSGAFSTYPLVDGDPLLSYSAARHFARPFPREHYRGPGDVACWRDIPTPGVASVFEYQGLDARDPDAPGLRGDSVEDWFYRLVGRMFFDIGEMDDFQVLIYLLGRAGTGKSTLAHFAAAGVYESEDVKQGDNMIERQFGLWPLMNALIVKFTEVKDNFQLDQAQLQEMVSGGSVNVARKNLIAAQQSQWRAHLVMCGNEMPGYRDTQGSLRRRYVIFNMTRKVKNENADLKKVMTADMPCFVLKCALAYRELVVVRGVRAGIWNHLPAHFHENADAIGDNSLAKFLRSDRVALSTASGQPEGCDFRDFKAEYNDFCRKEGLTKNVDLNAPNQYNGILDDHGVSVRKGEVPALVGASLTSFRTGEPPRKRPRADGGEDEGLLSD